MFLESGEKNPLWASHCFLPFEILMWDKKRKIYEWFIPQAVVLIPWSLCEQCVASILENCPGALAVGGAVWPERQRIVKINFLMSPAQMYPSVIPNSLLINFSILCFLLYVLTSSMEEENESHCWSCFPSTFLCSFAAFHSGMPALRQWSTDWLGLYSLASEWVWISALFKSISSSWSF